MFRRTSCQDSQLLGGVVDISTFLCSDLYRPSKFILDDPCISSLMAESCVGNKHPSTEVTEHVEACQRSIACWMQSVDAKRWYMMASVLYVCSRECGCNIILQISCRQQNHKYREILLVSLLGSKDQGLRPKFRAI